MFYSLWQKIAFKRIVSASLFLAVLSGGAFSQASSSCKLAFNPKVVEVLTKQSDRPTTEIVKNTDAEKIWKHLEPKMDLENDPRFYKVLENTTSELFENLQGRDIYFVARDGEWFYDAMTASLLNYPKADKLKDRIHLLNLSRPVAIYTEAATLMKYLEANGMDIEAILSGKSKVILVDTGERGSIFIALLQKIVQTQDFSGANWLERLENLLNGFEVRLLHSSEKDNRAQLLKRWKKMKEFDSDTIAYDLHSLGFPALLANKRKEIGIPTNHEALHDWIVEEFERRKHWSGRATAVNTKGKVTKTESIDSDRTQALYNQARIIWHFSSDAVKKRLANPIKTALSSCGKKCSNEQTKVDAEPLPNVSTEAVHPVKIKSGISLKPGSLVITPSGRKFIVDKFIDAGKRGKVYLVKSTDSNDVWALKVAIDSSSETLKSFAEEAEKNKGYKMAGIPHAKLIELGPDFMVKEYVEGTRADAWLSSWEAENMPSDTLQLKNLSKILKTAAKRLVYIGDLNPKNLIWNGKQWIVVDSGSWRDDLNETEILKRYNEKVVSRWTKKFGPNVASKLSSQLNLLK